MQVKGLDEVRRGLKAISDELPETVINALLEGARVIVQGARPQIPRRSGKAQESLEGRSTPKGAKVVGGEGVPYFAWLVFGGKAGRNGSVMRPVIKEGRYIWPTYVEKRDEIQKIVADAIGDLAKSEGFKVI